MIINKTFFSPMYLKKQQSMPVFKSVIADTLTLKKTPEVPHTNNVRVNELTSEEIKSAFKIAENYNPKNYKDLTTTVMYTLLNNLGMKEFTEIIDKNRKNANTIEKELPNGSKIYFKKQSDREILFLSSPDTNHRFRVETTENGLSLVSIKDKNWDLHVESSIDTLSQTGLETLKNSINYFRTFIDKSSEQESSNYVSLGKLVPRHKGIIYKRVKNQDGTFSKIPVEVDIVKENGYSFNFMDGDEKIGDLKLDLYLKNEKFKSKLPIYSDYPEMGLVGDRIIVEFLENLKCTEYGGIGHLADLIEVACCKELGIEPNILSYSTNSAVPMHYKRGKRFLPFNLYNKSLILKYKNSSPDDIAKTIITKTPIGEKYNTSFIKDSFAMYLPKDLIKELEKELEEHPIF